MRIIIAGPCETDYFRKSLNITLEGAPPGQGQTPVGPLAIELIRRGHEVIVLTLDTLPDTPMRFKEGELDIRFLPYRGHGKYRARVRSMDLFAKEIDWLNQEIRTTRPDFVHVHWTYEYAEGGRRSGLPLLVTAHDSPYSVLLYYRNLYRAARFFMAARTIFRLNALSVVAPHLQSSMRAMGYRGHIDVIPNGLELNSPTVCKKELLHTSQINICAIGNTGKLKNILSVLKAFKRIKIVLPQSELHLFGPGLDVSYVGSQPGVIAHGSVANTELMEFHTQRTTLLIHPSLEEICPVAILEAMARGIPVIGGYKSGGVPYVFGNRLSDWLVDVKDPVAIADKAIKLLSDPECYYSVGDQSRQNAEKRFDIRLVVDQYEIVYHSIIDRWHNEVLE